MLWPLIKMCFQTPVMKMRGTDFHAWTSTIYIIRPEESRILKHTHIHTLAHTHSSEKMRIQKGKLHCIIHLKTLTVKLFMSFCFKLLSCLFIACFLTVNIFSFPNFLTVILILANVYYDYQVTGRTLSILSVLWGKYCYFSHFKDDKNEIGWSCLILQSG